LQSQKFAPTPFIVKFAQVNLDVDNSDLNNQTNPMGARRNVIVPATNPEQVNKSSLPPVLPALWRFV